MHFHRPLSTTLAVAALTSMAAAQVTFTIDNHGPTIAVPDLYSGFPITEGDILTPGTAAAFGPNPPALGPLAAPGIVISAGFGPPAPGLGLAAHGPCAGHAPGMLCPIEVDALSYGFEFPIPAGATPPGFYWFSVDEYAVGFPVPAPPNVASEGAFGPEFEGSADIFVDHGVPFGGPYPPFAFPPANTAAIDGNGLPNTGGFAYPGLGLFEPDFPIVPPDLGDNVDGIDVDGPPILPGAAPAAVYFSLDAGFIDPINGFPLTGAAAFHGFSGSDVLVSPIGGPPGVFAPAPFLGLDLIAGFDSDDLDALALAENGTGVYEPSMVPYDWVGGGTDMLLFSVRRGSAVIGFPDSIFGIPIEEGDILTTPLPPALGGVSPFPGIFMAAENLGLATARSFGALGDDLDALDISRMPVTDCNGNGIEDALDIALGGAPDCNMNGIPDFCEPGDCDGDGVLDVCEPDCDGDGIPDDCEPDCDGDGLPDDCEVDCDGNGIPDDCEFVDCNGNGVHDPCDILSGFSSDCDGNGVPDECDPDCDGDGIPDACEPDCDGNGVPDDCEADCDGNGIADVCELVDCNGNGVHDPCDILSGASSDCDGNGIPDECDPDCDSDGIPDACEPDCDGNGVPDDCEVDCDGNGIADVCEFVDCNVNGVHDP